MIRQYIVDAFTDQLFSGNPAAVCILDEYPEESLMLQIAAENRLSETAFLVPHKENGEWKIRWFTPTQEVDLCGHATLASAFALFNYFEKETDRIRFQYNGGTLTVKQENGWIEMEFPLCEIQSVEISDDMAALTGIPPEQAVLEQDLVLIYENEEQVEKAMIDQAIAEKLPGRMVHISAPGSQTDCVSRSFGPKIGIPEDPVCGSAHCTIVPYWAGKLGKKKLLARQASKRGGLLKCEIKKDKLLISGQAVLFSKGKICL